MFRQLSKVEQAHSDAIWSVDWFNFEDRSLIVTGSVDETVKIWDAHQVATSTNTASNNKLITSLNEQELAVVSIASQPHAKLIASSAMDGYIRIYELQQQQNATTTADEKSSSESPNNNNNIQVSLKKSIHAGPMNTWDIVFHPTLTNIIYCSTHNGEIHVHDIEQKQPFTKFTPTQASFALCVNINDDDHDHHSYGNMLASGHHDGSIHLFDVETQQLKHKLSGHALPVRSVCFSSTHNLLLSASQDHLIHMFDVRSGELVGALSGHQSWVLSVAAAKKSNNNNNNNNNNKNNNNNNSNNTNHFASASSDKRVKVWDIRTKECLHTFSSHQDQVWSVCYSPDGTQLASVSDDASLQLYDAHEK